MSSNSTVTLPIKLEEDLAKQNILIPIIDQNLKDNEELLSLKKLQINNSREDIVENLSNNLNIELINNPQENSQKSFNPINVIIETRQDNQEEIRRVENDSKPTQEPQSSLKNTSGVVEATQEVGVLPTNNVNHNTEESGPSTSTQPKIYVEKSSTVIQVVSDGNVIPIRYKSSSDFTESDPHSSSSNEESDGNQNTTNILKPIDLNKDQTKEHQKEKSKTNISTLNIMLVPAKKNTGNLEIQTVVADVVGEATPVNNENHGVQENRENLLQPEASSTATEKRLTKNQKRRLRKQAIKNKSKDKESGTTSSSMESDSNDKRKSKSVEKPSKTKESNILVQEPIERSKEVKSAENEASFSTQTSEMLAQEPVEIAEAKRSNIKAENSVTLDVKTPKMLVKEPPQIPEASRDNGNSANAISFNDKTSLVQEPAKIPEADRSIKRAENSVILDAKTPEMLVQESVEIPEAYRGNRSTANAISFDAKTSQTLVQEPVEIPEATSGNKSAINEVSLDAITFQMPLQAPAEVPESSKDKKNAENAVSFNAKTPEKLVKEIPEAVGNNESAEISILSDAKTLKLPEQESVEVREASRNIKSTTDATTSQILVQKPIEIPEASKGIQSAEKSVSSNATTAQVFMNEPVQVLETGKGVKSAQNVIPFDGKASQVVVQESVEIPDTAEDIKTVVNADNATISQVLAKESVKIPEASTDVKLVDNSVTFAAGTSQSHVKACSSELKLVHTEVENHGANQNLVVESIDNLQQSSSRSESESNQKESAKTKDSKTNKKKKKHKRSMPPLTSEAMLGLESKKESTINQLEVLEGKQGIEENLQSASGHQEVVSSVDNAASGNTTSENNASDSNVIEVAEMQESQSNETLKISTVVQEAQNNQTTISVPQKKPSKIPVARQKSIKHVETKAETKPESTKTNIQTKIPQIVKQKDHAIASTSKALDSDAQNVPETANNANGLPTSSMNNQRKDVKTDHDLMVQEKKNNIKKLRKIENEEKLSSTAGSANQKLNGKSEKQSPDELIKENNVLDQTSEANGSRSVTSNDKQPIEELRKIKLEESDESEDDDEYEVDDADEGEEKETGKEDEKYVRNQNENTETKEQKDSIETSSNKDQIIKQSSETSQEDLISESGSEIEAILRHQQSIEQILLEEMNERSMPARRPRPINFAATKKSSIESTTSSKQLSYTKSLDNDSDSSVSDSNIEEILDRSDSYEDFDEFDDVEPIEEDEESGTDDYNKFDDVNQRMIKDMEINLTEINAKVNQMTLNLNSQHATLNRPMEYIEETCESDEYISDNEEESDDDDDDDEEEGNNNNNNSNLDKSGTLIFKEELTAELNVEIKQPSELEVLEV